MDNLRFSATEIAAATSGNWVPNDTIPPNELEILQAFTDTRHAGHDGIFFAIRGENFDGHQFLQQAQQAGAKAVCIDQHSFDSRIKLPDIPILVVANTITAYQQFAHLYRSKLEQLKVIAVTGSMGKTSVKEMLKAIFATQLGSDKVYATYANTNNQIGVPQNIGKLTPKHRACILELGTNHFGEIKPLSLTAEPDVAIVNNIASCHLEHLKSLHGVASEKSQIFAGLKPNGIAVIPYNTASVEVLRNASKKFKTLSFGLESEADIQVEYLGGNIDGGKIRLIINCQNGKDYTLNLPTPGKHQALNAAAATAAALALDTPTESIITGLSNYTLPGMRMNITKIADTFWINDAYNANPQSMLAAAEWLQEFTQKQKLLVVLGDMLELGETELTLHQETLNQIVKLLPHASFCLIGELMTKAKQALKDAPQITAFSDCQAAQDYIAQQKRQYNYIFLKGSRGLKLEQLLPK